MSLVESLKESFWKRYSNPKSGWSRVLTLPTLLTAVYHRNWRLAAVAVVFTAIKPVLFSPPENEDAWMTRVVLAERWWSADRKRNPLARTYPGVLNLINVPVTAYAFLAAYRRDPVANRVRRRGLHGAEVLVRRRSRPSLRRCQHGTNLPLTRI